MNSRTLINIMAKYDDDCPYLASKVWAPYNISPYYSAEGLWESHPEASCGIHETFRRS